jgi:hypothetical protein
MSLLNNPSSLSLTLSEPLSPLSIPFSSLTSTLSAPLSLSHSVSEFVSISSTPQSQIQALFDLYNSTNGKNWRWRGTQSPWIFSSTTQLDPCNTNGDTWQGITCSLASTLCQFKVCEITEINLPAYGLDGQLPSSLSLLSKLSVFVVDLNQLSGSIPSSLGLLSQLQQLSIVATLLSGSIPTSLGLLSQLQTLALCNNPFLFGPIPSSLGLLSQLTRLDLYVNMLSNTLPSSLGSLSELRVSYFMGTLYLV